MRVLKTPTTRTAPSVRVERAGPADLAVLAGFEIDPQQLRFFDRPGDVVADTLRRGRLLLAIRADGETVGFAVLHRDRRDAAAWWLAWFMIDRRHQGRGIARPALRAVLRHITTRPGCRRMHLQVTAENAVARTLYLKFGFRDTGDRAADGDDILVLAHALATFGTPGPTRIARDIPASPDAPSPPRGKPIERPPPHRGVTASPLRL
jgi:diamine N-acetyltransferase